MAKLYAMYKAPADPAAFERYYFERHVPVARRIPGLRDYEVTRGALAAPGGAAPYYMIATLTFDSVDAIRAALRSPEGQAAAADLANFASAGVDLVFAQTEPA